MQVVCATCTGAGDEERLQGRRYKMVVVDEATQATEPSNLIPLVTHPHPPRTWGTTHVPTNPAVYC